jgi:integrase
VSPCSGGADGEKRADTAGRRPNADYRTREHLTETEIEKLIEAAKTNRHGHRDSTMVLVAYRHGLRASELCELSWDDIDLRAAAMHVNG